MAFQEIDATDGDIRSHHTPGSGTKRHYLWESEILQELRDISLALIITPRHELSREGRVEFGQRLLSSDRKIMKQILPIDENETIQSIIARGAILYSQVVLRGMNRSSRVVKALITQLRKSLISAMVRRVDVFADDPAVLPLGSADWATCCDRGPR